MAPADYQWGIFVLPTRQASIEFGEFKGEKLWETAPDDCYYLLLDHIVTQADAEHGSVEQCRTLTQTAPSAFDLENLFQFSLEEGRHSWSMVHLLLEHFGADGTMESEQLLHRMCGETSRPRLLNAFNYATDDWLAHFLWCFLADRTARYQLDAVSRGAFKPLRETVSYMLLEEPMHIQFGFQGLERTIAQSARATLQRNRLDIFDDGAIPLPVIQRYMNFWMPAVYDLFGNDESSHAADMYRLGIRSPSGFGAWTRSAVVVETSTADGIRRSEVAPELAINTVMRRQFIGEVEHTVERWNRSLARLHIDYRLKVPHERFNRQIGAMKGAPVDPDGTLFGENRHGGVAEYLPTVDDRARVRALMARVLESGRCASWIAPPSTGLNDVVLELGG
nr:benzoyl-coA 2,3-epoxidase [uncultured bacterium]